MHETYNLSTHSSLMIIADLPLKTTKMQVRLTEQVTHNQHYQTPPNLLIHLTGREGRDFNATGLEATFELKLNAWQNTYITQLTPRGRASNPLQFQQNETFLRNYNRTPEYLIYIWPYLLKTHARNIQFKHTFKLNDNCRFTT